MQTLPRALILDWDNTLIDGNAYFARVDAAVFDQIHREDGVAAEGPHESLPGESDLAFFARLLGGSERLAQKAADLFEGATRGGAMAVDFMPGATDLLRFLADHDIPHAIHSNSEDGYLKDFVAVSLIREGIAPPPPTVGIVEGEIAKKPDPGGIREALRRLGIDTTPESAGREVWIIGDSPKSDGMAGLNAGIRVGLVPYKGTALDTAHEEWTVFADLIELKETIAARLAGQNA